MSKVFLQVQNSANVQIIYDRDYSKDLKKSASTGLTIADDMAFYKN